MTRSASAQRVFSIDDATVLIETVTYSPLAIKLVAFGELAFV
jgi:hypothetical protein